MRRLGVILAVAALAAPTAAHAAVNPQIAGLQVALRAHGLYLAQIDGIAGPTDVGRRARVPAPQPPPGRRRGPPDARCARPARPAALRLAHASQGDFGWDVAVLQFLLVRRGVYNGALDGYMGKETGAALRRYQRAMHLHADAVVGPRTLTAIVRHDRVPVRARVQGATGAPTVRYVVHEGDSLTRSRAHTGRPSRRSRRSTASTPGSRS